MEDAYILLFIKNVVLSYLHTPPAKVFKKYSYINYSVRLGQNYCKFFHAVTRMTTFSTFDSDKNLNFKFSPFIAAGFPPPYFQFHKNTNILPFENRRVYLQLNVIGWMCMKGRRGTQAIPTIPTLVRRREF
jgi:hypothetical protein